MTDDDKLDLASLKRKYSGHLPPAVKERYEARGKAALQATAQEPAPAPIASNLEKARAAKAAKRASVQDAPAVPQGE